MGVAGHDKHRDAKVAAQAQPALERLPVLGPGLPLAREEASLKARGHRRDAVPAKRLTELRDSPSLQECVGLTEPEIDRIDMAGGVVLEHGLERGVKTADGRDRGSHASRSRSMSTTSASGTRS